MRPLFLSVLLISAFAVAQEFPTKGPATHDPTKESSRPGTYQGCVVRAKDGLILDSITNRQYKLTGARLDSYVGQEVTLTAHNVNPNDPSSDERNMSDGEQRNGPTTLAVEDIQQLADSCQSKK